MDKVLHCECGFGARAADGEGLVAEVQRHAREVHGMALSDDEALLLTFRAELGQHGTVAVSTRSASRDPSEKRDNQRREKEKQMARHRTRRAVIGITAMLVAVAALVGVTLVGRIGNGPGTDLPGVGRMSNAERTPTLLSVRMASAPATDAFAARQPAPSATEFAADFVGFTNDYAQKHRDAARVGNSHCVQAAPGRYMCSYVVIRNGASTCHLMQARWTPDRASTFTVTLAGRTARCASVRDAIRSLR